MKPENIVMGEDGYVAITDFGYSERLQSFNGKNLRNRGAKELVGTPAYFSPETIKQY